MATTNGQLVQYNVYGGLGAKRAPEGEIEKERRRCLPLNQVIVRTATTAGASAPPEAAATRASARSRSRSRPRPKRHFAIQKKGRRLLVPRSSSSVGKPAWSRHAAVASSAAAGIVVVARRTDGEDASSAHGRGSSGPLRRVVRVRVVAADGARAGGLGGDGRPALVLVGAGEVVVEEARVEDRRAPAVAADGGCARLLERHEIAKGWRVLDSAVSRGRAARLVVALSIGRARR